MPRFGRNAQRAVVLTACRFSLESERVLIALPILKMTRIDTSSGCLVTPACSVSPYDARMRTLRAIEANPTPFECHVTCGRDAATRGPHRHVICSQRCDWLARSVSSAPSQNECSRGGWMEDKAACCVNAEARSGSFLTYTGHGTDHVSLDLNPESYDLYSH